MNTLVTGGAGFVGSHLVDARVAAGHSVHVLDLDPQVHGAGIQRDLGYRSEVSLEDGMRQQLDWLRTREATDSVESAADELERRGLVR